MFSMFEQMDALHPWEAYWHLPLIGVDPVHQGKGIGSALLSVVLNVCDSRKVSAYLEATSPRNVPLYERHGFEAVGSGLSPDYRYVAQTKARILTMIIDRSGSTPFPWSLAAFPPCRPVSVSSS